MLSDSPFYHSSIRNILVAFGRLFTNIEFERKNNEGIVVQRIKVPVAPGHTSKWLSRIKSDPELSGKTQVVLPRIGFEMVGFQYDPTRKLQVLTQFHGNKSGDINDLQSSYSPVPYNINFDLYIVGNTMGDCLQIVENILPYFTPGYIVTVKMFPEVGISQDIPFVLNGVNFDDSYEGSFETKRLVTYVLNFTAKAELLGPIKKNGSTILHTRVKLGESDPLERLNSWDVNDDGTITGDWSDIQ